MTETESFTTRILEEKPSALQISARGIDREVWDVATLVEQILEELDGKVDRSEVEQVVRELLPQYKDARVGAFVPIFIRKEALSQLRRESI